MPIPANPDLILSVFASGGDRTAPPQTSPTGFVNFENGYGPDYEIDLTSGNTSAKAVERPVQNYLFGLMTELGQFWQQMGAPPWYSTMPAGYNQGAVVGRVSSGGLWQLWRSLVNSNVVDPNATGQTSWEYIPLNTELIKEISMPAGGVADVSPGGQTAELITVATDFNTLTTGTWEYGSDAIANGSAHAPVQLGTSGTFAGMLEAKQWTLSGSTFNSQRYSDRSGNMFFRGATNGTWTAWSSVTTVSDFSTDTGAVNAVQGNALLSSTALVDNQKFWVKIANANTGPTTFSPNTGITAKALLGPGGLALQGGELVADTRALIVYKASTNNFILALSTGSRTQVLSATQSNHAVPATQVQSNALNYAADTGTANVYAVALSPVPAALVDGMIFAFQAANANTGASTLNLNGIGAKPILGAAHSALQGGEIIAASKVEVIWHAGLASFILLESTGGAMQVAAATQSNQALQLGQATGRFLGVTSYIFSGTFTPNPKANTTEIIAIGGGGSGGNTQATGAASAAAAAGGWSGAYVDAIFSGKLTGPITVTVGGGGVAAAVAGAAGVAGGTTSVGALVSCPGGPGGAAGVNTATFPLVTYQSTSTILTPTVTGGTIINGSGTASGSPGVALGSAVNQQLIGAGAQSFVGFPGSGSGAGGGGAFAPASSAYVKGANGQIGLVIIREYS